MLKFESLACGSFGLMASALILIATLAPVSAAQAGTEIATACVGAPTMGAAGQRVFLA